MPSISHTARSAGSFRRRTEAVPVASRACVTNSSSRLMAKVSRWSSGWSRAVVSSAVPRFILHLDTFAGRSQPLNLLALRLRQHNRASSSIPLAYSGEFMRGQLGSRKRCHRGECLLVLAPIIAVPKALHGFMVASGSRRLSKPAVSSSRPCSRKDCAAGVPDDMWMVFD